MDSRVRFNLALPDDIDDCEPSVTSGYDGDNEDGDNKKESAANHPQESQQNSKNSPKEYVGKPPRHLSYNSQVPLTMLLNSPLIGGQFRLTTASLTAPASAVFVSQTTSSTNYTTPAAPTPYAPATKRRR